MSPPISVANAVVDYKKYARLPGRVLMIGFGSIGRGTLPLILRHLEVRADQIAIIAADSDNRSVADEYGVPFTQLALTPANYEAELRPRLAGGDFLVNLSVDVSSIALIELCQELGVFYIDTCIEPWAGDGGYFDARLPMAARTNYALRESARALKPKYRGGTTAVVANGANPGLVSHLAKQALLNLQRDILGVHTVPRSREEWAALAQRLNVKVIHVAERDTQVTDRPKQVGEFVNTWSVEGFISEGCQPAELGWGTHEKALPRDGATHSPDAPAIYLRRPGVSTKVRTWTPRAGPFHGFLITHNEAISISDYFTVRGESGAPVYRPTCHYAYHPCDAAVVSVHELYGSNLAKQTKHRILCNDITDGVDELGVLLAGHARGAYWYGSQLSIREARQLAPFNTATSLQVTSAVLAGMVWALENPRAGVVEADEMDYKRNLDIQAPYLGPVVGAYTSWTPVQDRGTLFPEELDRDDPWQFSNVRVD